jgi:hypothetical protein
VGRIPRISSQYLRDHGSLEVRKDASIARDIGRIVRALANADVLPEPGDARGIMPLTGGASVQTFAYARRVFGRSLWVWYQVSDGEVRLVGLTRQLTDG